MPSLIIIYNADDQASRRQAIATQKHAAADFEVSIVPLSQPDQVSASLPETPVDVVLLLGAVHATVVRDALRQRGWPSRLVVRWYGFPAQIGRFTAMRDAADAWIFDNQTAWEATGRLPRTFMISGNGNADIARFFEVFREILDFDHTADCARHDLSDTVTAFVTTVGAPTFERCLRHLREQDCTFRLEIIDHVAPMNVAFQRMLDECRTPYYVQVDEDMLLHPHAVRTLHETIETAGPNVAIYSAELYDVHLERCIRGIKIFRHEIVRQYPFEAKGAFEVDQITQLKRDGYQVLLTDPGPEPVAGRTLGLHGTQWTLRSIYERYAKLERGRRSRLSRLQWFEPYGAEFLRRFLDEPTEENFFCLMGFVAGVLGSQNGEAGAKDYRKYHALPGFETLQKFLHEVRADVVNRERHDPLSTQARSRASRRRSLQR